MSISGRLLHQEGPVDNSSDPNLEFEHVFKIIEFVILYKFLRNFNFLVKHKSKIFRSRALWFGLRSQNML